MWTPARQVDLLVYDQLTTAPLLADGDRVLLPAEALLAAVEVKSRLTKDDSSKAIAGMAKIRRFRPWDADWGRTRKRGDPADEFPRVFTSVLAFDTDLKADGWARSEMVRFRQAAEELGARFSDVDRVAVLSRGMIHPATGRAVSLKEDRMVLGTWYSALLNFLAREVDRRKEFPWAVYESNEGKIWEQVLAPGPEAPAPRRYRRAQRKRYRRGR